MLEGGEAGRVGCVVNDVAEVNIDAKLVRKTGVKSVDGAGPGGAPPGKRVADLADTVELDNGCACCTAGDDLFQALAQLVTLSKKRGRPFDRIIIENSGVAEPANIRDRFQEAAVIGLPILRQIRLQNMLTVVDSSAFFKEYASKDAIEARPDLGDAGGANRRPVVDLLCEQVEYADVVTLNKADTLDGPDLDKLETTVKFLNPLARVVRAEFGNVPLDLVLDTSSVAPMISLTVEGQHRGAVTAARLAEEQQEKQDKKDREAQHGHDHDHAKCDHPDHKHDHGHDHGHGHGHGHDHDHAKCDHPDHDHDHGHHHSHDTQETTAAKRFGIRTFVYSSRRPFNMQRLRAFVDTHFKKKNRLDSRAPDTDALKQAEVTRASCMAPVLRSKGFVWLASAHESAWYWSHAGTHFEVVDEGEWWCAIPDNEWPPDVKQRDAVLADFQGPWGDRRQEIVFIGVDMDEPAIKATLDAALVTDAEMTQYRELAARTPDPVHSFWAPSSA